MTRAPTPRIRSATAKDVASMVALSRLKRLRYARHFPVFWASHPHADDAQHGFFLHLLDQPDTICLVCDGASSLSGFLIGRTGDAPPVYQPGGKVLMIDDFALADHADWRHEGDALLRECERIAASRGACLSVTICGAHDDPKRAMLRAVGAQPASEWYVHTFNVQGADACS